MNLPELFEKHNDEFLAFRHVSNPMSKRADLHAFLLLDKIVPSESDIVSNAEHDEIWLDVDITEFGKWATEEQILELIRCGVRFDKSNNCLCMFV